jgi:cell wall-associated NlpC family hydrolase
MRHSGFNERDVIVRYARNMMDKSYAYGQNDPSAGFDCSGLVFYAYKEAGIKIPRTTASQYLKGRKIDLKDASEGDLVFFSTVGAGATHVGLYLGNGKFIHSPSEGKKVQIVDMEKNYWKKVYYGTVTFF